MIPPRRNKIEYGHVVCRPLNKYRRLGAAHAGAAILALFHLSRGAQWTIKQRVCLDHA